MLTAKETIEFWADKLGLSQKEKTRKKRVKFREAKKKERQSQYGYGKAVGNKAVKNQLRKQRQMDRIAKGDD